MIFLFSCTSVSPIYVPFQTQFLFSENNYDITGIFIVNDVETMNSLVSHDDLENPVALSYTSEFFESSQLIVYIPEEPMYFYNVGNVVQNSDDSWSLGLKKTSLQLESETFVLFIEIDKVDNLTSEMFEVAMTNAVETNFALSFSYQYYSIDPLSVNFIESSCYLSRNIVINSVAEFSYYTRHNPNLQAFSTDFYSDSFFEDNTLIIVNFMEKSFSFDILEVDVINHNLQITIWHSDIYELSFVYSEFWIEVKKNEGIASVNYDYFQF